MKREKTLYDFARNTVQYQLNQYARRMNFNPSLMKDLKCQVGHIRSLADLLDEFLAMKGIRHADVKLVWEKSLYNGVRWQVIGGELGIEWKKSITTIIASSACKTARLTVSAVVTMHHIYPRL